MRRLPLLALPFVAVLTTDISRADPARSPGSPRKAAKSSSTPVQQAPTLDYVACAAWVKTVVQGPVDPGATGPALDLQTFFYPQAQIGTSPVSKLLLFGGRDHKVFLGCLNCPSTERESIWNKDGPHGTGIIASDSIWKRYSDYGSEYGDYSPWANTASKPPVIVDQMGTFHGHFTVSTYDTKKTNHPVVRMILDIIQTVRAAR